MFRLLENVRASNSKFLTSSISRSFSRKQDESAPPSAVPHVWLRSIARNFNGVNGRTYFLAAA